MNEQNEGMGGSYTINPQTGERTLVERTNEFVTADYIGPNPEVWAKLLAQGYVFPAIDLESPAAPIDLPAE